MLHDMMQPFICGSRECHVWVDEHLHYRDSPNSPAYLPVITCVPTTSELQLGPCLLKHYSDRSLKPKAQEKNKTCVQAYEWV